MNYKPKPNNKYKTNIEPYLEDITDWFMMGESIVSVCKKLGISRKGFRAWRQKKPELVAAIEAGKNAIPEHLGSMLYKRCNGYVVTEKRTIIEAFGDDEKKKKKRVEVTEKYIPPSDTAIIFALVNRDSKNWKRNPDIEAEKEEVKTNEGSSVKGSISDAIDKLKKINEEL
jgi:hypothetical protein